jgi:hypothetical protein
MHVCTLVSNEILTYYHLQDVICLNAKTDIFQAHLQSESVLPIVPPILPPAPKTPPQTFRDLTLLMSTPNKRPYENEEFQL